MFDQWSNLIRQLWKNLSTICNLKGKKYAISTVPSQNVNGKMIDNPKYISNTFNEYFNTVTNTYFIMD